MKQLSLREFGSLKTPYVAPGLPDSRVPSVMTQLVPCPHFVGASAYWEIELTREWEVWEGTASF